ncbi:MAG: F0F1 ATP synthase subunit epsilon [Cyanobacteria bacterium J06597_16]
MSLTTTTDSAMHLTVTLPHHVLVDAVVTRLVAEGTHGSFCLLPKHIDCLSILEPGIFIYETADEQEKVTENYLAMGQGLLVKQGVSVSVSVWEAIAGDNLAQLHQAVETQFRQLDEQARLTQTALARLEAGLSRQFSVLMEGA